MHQVLQKQYLFHLLAINLEQEYEQNIDVTVTLNANTEKQTLNKTLIYKSQSVNSNQFKIQFNSKNINLKLEPKYIKHELLNKQLAKIVDSIEFEINEKNIPLKILNQNQIISKWEITKTELYKKYKGDYAENYFFGLNKRINNQESLLKNLLQINNYGMFFILPFSLYNLNQKYKNQRILNNMIANLPVSVDEEITLITSNNLNAVFKINGALSATQKYPNKIKNYFTRQNISKENKLKIDNYSGTLILDNSKGLLKEFKLRVSISYGERFKKTIQYATIIK